MVTQKEIQDAIRASFSSSPYKAGSVTPVTGNTSSKLLSETEVKRSKALSQNAKYIAQIESLSGKKAKDHGKGQSILGRIGDVISRPLYAVNELVDSSIKSAREGDNLLETVGSGIHGVGSGLAGTQKTHFSDIMQTTGLDKELLDHGTAGKVGLIAASIIGDVALDPLTYVTFGTAKVGQAQKIAGALSDGLQARKAVEPVILANAAENALKVAKDLPDATKLVKGLAENPHAVERAVKTVEDATTMAARTMDAAYASKEVRLIAKERVATKIAELRASGTKVSRITENNLVQSEIPKIAAEIASKTQEAGQFKKYLTIGTKNHKAIIPFSDIIPAASAEVKKAVMATGLGGDIANKFSSKHMFGAMNLIKRREESAGVARSEELIKLARTQFGKLSKSDSDNIVEAYMSRNLKGLTPELQTAATNLKGHLDDMYIEEIKSGIRNATPEQIDIITKVGNDPQAVAQADSLLRDSLSRDPNYVEGFIPQYYKGESETVKLAQKAKSDALKAGKTPWQAEQAARDYGVKPLTKVDDILANYTARVMRPQIRKAIKADAIREYGIQFDNIKNPTKTKFLLEERNKAKAIKDPVDRLEVLSKIDKQLESMDDLIAEVADKMQLVKVDPKFYLGLPPDTYLPKSIMTSINHIDEFYKDPEKAKELLKFYDKLLSQFKTSATLLNPASWVRNFMGDSFQAYVAGVRDPTLYKDALSILRVEPGTGKYIALGGQKFSKEKLFQLFETSGAKSGFIRSEYGSGKMLEGIRGAAEVREDVPRLATWLHTFRQEAAEKLTPLNAQLSDLEKLNKAQNFSNPSTLKELNQLRNKILHVEEQISHNAAGTVTKWMVDYGDFTKFEMNTMRRVMPFYSFMRKNLPLQIEGLAMRPGAYNNTMNVGRNLDEYMADPEDPGIYPKWLRDLGFARMGMTDSGGAVVWSPALPFQDLEKNFGGGAQGIVQNQMSALTPAITAPMEYAFGKDLFSGKDISNQGTMPFFTGQIPLYTTGKNWINAAKNTVEGNDQSLSVLNQLFGLGIQEVSPEQMNSEVKRQQFELIGELKKLKEANGLK